MTEYERRIQPRPRPAARSSPRPGAFRPRSRPAARPAATARKNTLRPAARPAVSRTYRPAKPAAVSRPAAARTTYRQPSKSVRTVRARGKGFRSWPNRPRYPRYPRRPRRWWGYSGGPAGYYDFPVDDVYGAGSEPVYLPRALQGISDQGRRALQRAGLLSGAYAQRLQEAPAALHDFIRRFSRTAGFAVVVLRYFGSPIQRSAAVLSTRLANRIASRVPDFQRRMVFAEDMGAAPGGTYLSLRLEFDDRHYLFLPWTSLDPRAVRRQLARDQALYGDTSTIRWVFSARRLGGMPKEAVVDRLRRVSGAAGPSPEDEPQPVPGRSNGNGAAHSAPDFNRMVMVL